MKANLVLLHVGLLQFVLIYIMLNLYIQHLLLSVQSASKDRGEQSYEFYHLLILGHFRE